MRSIVGSQIANDEWVNPRYAAKWTGCALI
jgi:hypothetical protein